MTRFYLQCALSMLILLALPALAIRAQPYDDQDLRTLLTPERCPQPCFMGIRPGFTTLDEAVRILEAHPWVETVTRQDIVVFWSWNGQNPDFLDSAAPPMLTAIGMAGTAKPVVGIITVPTRLPVGLIYLTLHEPDGYIIHRPTVRSPNPAEMFIYYGVLSVNGALNCPPRLDTFWREAATFAVWDHRFSGWSRWNRAELRNTSYNDTIC